MTIKLELEVASVTDEAAIVAFIDRYWRKNHVFVSNPELLRWQHQADDRPEERLNFVIARRERGDGAPPELLGLLGFIPFRRFDRDADWTDLSLAIWKVRDDAPPGLGLRLLKEVERQRSPALICAIGISDMVKPIYGALGYSLASLTHAALFDPSRRPDSCVADGVPDAAWRDLRSDERIELRPLSARELERGGLAEEIDRLGAAASPRKSSSYVLNRFCRHPWYAYDVRAVLADGRAEAVLVWRRVTAMQGAVLRIVDLVGNAEIVARCGPALRQAVQAAGCEYVDLVCYGVPGDALRRGGFVSTSDHPGLVLPNYFDPFERRNVVIDIAWRRRAGEGGQPVRLFRADSDQDRPNSSASLPERQ
ncbi:MAG TPA: hypothetical protein VD788_15875 [Candidatus Polarisedimenticolaceae bacterium]|nr:hypothetical protein [Candidatus Polarisedimenticolaceae bacterium]